MSPNTTKQTQKRIYLSDRFIPARSAMDFDFCHNMMANLKLDDKPAALAGTVDLNRPISYNELLAANFLPRSASYSQPRPLLAIRASTISESRAFDVDNFHTFRLPTQVTIPLRAACTKNARFSRRYIPSSPSCILDAPELRDDYYLNLMDWGSNGVIAVALDQNVYLYTTTTGRIQKINACSNPIDYVTSVAWVENTSPFGGGTHRLAVGTFLAELQIWDVDVLMKVRSMCSHRGRIGSLSWGSHRTLASGSRDSTIHLNDVRCAQHVVGKLVRRRGEICGLAWSPDGSTLASGSNDSNLCLWDRAMVRSNGLNSVSCPRLSSSEHCAAVRALAWSPWDRHVLASGGGTADGTIKLWRTWNGKLIRSVPTGSQVCSLAWSTSTRELVSAHGHCSTRNQLTVWKYPTMKVERELTGHTARVLHVALSPNGSSVVSAGADETLRFWDVFPLPDRPCRPRHRGIGGDFSMPTAVIR
ncbi:ubiquitin-protein transferase activating protein [Phytophthora pseudosyringae]|uniref:Ubiquitin-protein transferase activating protein n=1 Tax=Phytophthora pseudosyringae TaxID=221518 RepID=A0A8T1VTR1_9STRA|nr:ubiquitin-protein transferase activating protein [Phytophthora pseudosyringae]